MPILGIIASKYVAPVAGYAFWGAKQDAVVASTDGISWDFKPSNDIAITAGVANVGAGNLFVANSKLIMNNQFWFLNISTNGTTWDFYNNNTTATVGSVIYQNSKYTAIINDVFTAGNSTDLITWTFPSMPEITNAPYLYSIAYGNGAYVAVGDTNYCISSTDAITWTSRTINFGAYDLIKKVIYGDKFVAVGNNNGASSGIIATSTDGTTWTTRTTASGWTIIYDVAYDSSVGRYVAVGRNYSGDKIAQYSTDGITWTASSTTGGPDFDYTYVSAGNGTYVAIASGQPEFFTSTNGSTWASKATYNSETGFNYKPAYFDSKWWFAKDYTTAGGGSILVNTTDFTTWTVVTGSPSKTVAGIGFSPDRLGYMNGKYIFVSNNSNSSSVKEVFNSTDLVTWTKNSMQSGTMYNIFYGNGVYVSGGASGVLQTSTDLVTWTTRTSNFGTSSILTGTYANSTYVIGGGNGKLSTSTDAITWTTRTVNFGTNNIQHIRYLNNLFIACGNAGSISTSTDAITWTSRTSGTSEVLRGLAYGASTYLVVGNTNTIRTSTNAITWSAVTNPGGITDNAFNWIDASFKNDIFLVSAQYNGSVTQGVGTVYLTSTNGTTWTSRRNDKIGWYGSFVTSAV